MMKYELLRKLLTKPDAAADHCFSFMLTLEYPQTTPTYAIPAAVLSSLLYADLW